MASKAIDGPRRVKVPSEEEMSRHGITRVTADYFEFGGYRYSNLADAMAQARRGSAGEPS